MELPRTAMASTLIVVWLLILHSSWLQVPCAHGADDCWVLDRDRYRYCFRTAKCRAACAEDHFVDGRCKKGFPYLLPLCECLRPQCMRSGAAAGATSRYAAELGSIPPYSSSETHAHA